MNDYLNQRTFGNLPLSISTSLAIESLMDENKKKTKQYDELWINLRTLVRNIFTSLDAETQSMVSDSELTHVAINEIEEIESILKEDFPTLRIRFYINFYDKLKKKFKEASIRVAKTERQKFYRILLDNVYSNINSFYGQEKKILSFDSFIEPSISVKAIFLTHTLVDLASDRNFKEIVLLESYTGKLKSKSEWYTKFSAQAQANIPPNIQMISIYGDPEVFKPLAKKYRDAIENIAVQHNWSCVTTFDRMKLTVGLEKDAELKQYLLKFIHT